MRPASSLSSSALSYLESLEKNSKALRTTKNVVNKPRKPSISEIISQARRTSSLTRDNSEEADFLNESLKSSIFSEESGEKVIIFSSDSDNDSPKESARILPRGTPGMQVGRKSLQAIRELRNSIDQSLIKTPEIQNSKKDAEKPKKDSSRPLLNYQKETIDEETEEEKQPTKIVQKSPFKKYIESESSDAESIIFDEVFEDLPVEKVEAPKVQRPKKPEKPKTPPSSSNSDSEASSSSESESESESSSSESESSSSESESVATVIQPLTTKPSSSSSSSSSSSEPQNYYEDFFPSPSTVREEIRVPEVVPKLAQEGLKVKKKEKELEKTSSRSESEVSVAKKKVETRKKSKQKEQSESEEASLASLPKVHNRRKKSEVRITRKAKKKDQSESEQGYSSEREHRCHSNVHDVLKVVISTHQQLIHDFNQVERASVKNWKIILNNFENGHDGPTTKKLRDLIEQRINRDKYL